jgi:hypothetical protein
MDRYEIRPAVFTAYSKHFFFAKMLISAYVLDKDYIPLNPFNNWEYFMDDMVDRDLVVRGNNNLVLLADEVWTFGPIADGVFAEVKLANEKNIPVKYFAVGKKLSDIQPLKSSELVFEDELLQQFSKAEILKEFGQPLTSHKVHKRVNGD